MGEVSAKKSDKLSGEERILRYRKESSEKNKKRIAEFVQANRCKPSVYELRGKKLLLIQESNLPKPLPEKFSNYIERARLVEEKGIGNNCYAIANNACKDGLATGRVATWEGASEFVGYGNHCINFTEWENSVFAFDLTASRDIDADQGNFSVLAIEARELDQLLLYLNELYGGDWQVIQIDEF